MFMTIDGQAGAAVVLMDPVRHPWTQVCSFEFESSVRLPTASSDESCMTVTLLL